MVGKTRQNYRRYKPTVVLGKGFLRRKERCLPCGDTYDLGEHAHDLSLSLCSRRLAAQRVSVDEVEALGLPNLLYSVPKGSDGASPEYTLQDAVLRVAETEGLRQEKASLLLRNEANSF